MDRGAWQATVLGVTKSDMTKQLTLTIGECSHKSTQIQEKGPRHRSHLSENLWASLGQPQSPCWMVEA